MGNRIVIDTKLSTEGFKRGTAEIKRSISNLSRTAKRSFSQIERTLTKVISPIGKSVQRAGTTLAATLRRVLPLLIGVGSAFGILSKAVSAYMSQNEELSNKLSSIWTALGNLIGPIIEQIIDWVRTAVSYFLEFLRLLGVTSKTASQLSQKAKKNTEELRSIMGFDELNVLQDRQDTDDNGNGQGLKDVELPDWMKQFIEFLKSGMWHEAAKIITDKINELIDLLDKKAYEIGKKIGYWLNGFMTIIADFIKNIHWAELGGAIAKGVNGILDSVEWENLGTIIMGKLYILWSLLSGFLANLDWRAAAIAVSDTLIGALKLIEKGLEEALEVADGETRNRIQKISDGIIEFIKTLKWTEIGEHISKVVEDALDVLLTHDWETQAEELARGLSKLINAVKWAELGDKLGTLLSRQISSALTFAITFIKETKWKDVGRGVREFFENLDWEEIKGKLKELLGDAWEAALDFLEGLLLEEGEDSSSLIEALRHLGESIGNIFESISKVWTEKVKPWLSDNIPKIIEQLAKALDDLAKILSGEMNLGEFVSNMNALEAVLVGLAAIKGISIFSSLLTFFDKIPAGTTAISGLASVFGSFAGKIKEVIELTAGGAGTLGESVAAVFPNAAALGTAALGVFDAVMVAYDVVKLKQVSDGFKETNQAQLESIQSTIEGYARSIEGSGQEVADKVYGEVYGIDLAAMSSIEEKVAALAEAAQGQFEGTAHGLGDAFSLALKDAFSNPTKDFEQEFQESFSGISTIFTEAANDMQQWGVVTQGTIEAFHDRMEEFKTSMTEGVSGIESASPAVANLNEKVDALTTAYSNAISASAGYEEVTQARIELEHGLTQALADYLVELANSGSITADFVTQMTEQGAITSEVIRLMEEQGVIIQSNGEVITRTADAVKGQANAAKDAADKQKEATKAISDTNTELKDMPGTADAAGKGMEGFGSATEGSTGKVTTATGNMEVESKKDLEALTADVTKAKEDIKKEFDEIALISETVKTTMEGIKRTVATETQLILGDLHSWRSSTISVLNEVLSYVQSDFQSGWQNAWYSARDSFAVIFSDLPEIMRGPVNGVIGILNQAIDSLNYLIDGANSLGQVAGFSISYLNYLPFLAKGGVLKKGQIGLLEGDGAEAVVPLEKNTEWIGKVADQFLAAIQNGDYALSGNAKMISTIQALENSVTFRAPAIAQGTVMPYSIDTGSGNTSSSPADITELLEAIRESQGKMDDIIYLLENLQVSAEIAGGLRVLARAIKKELRKESITEGV